MGYNGVVWEKRPFFPLASRFANHPHFGAKNDLRNIAPEQPNMGDFGKRKTDGSSALNREH